LQAFGRGYKHDQARLEKLIRDFPQLDVEEEIADGLDWLDRPENRKRVNSLGFHRNSCKRAEARRLADLATAAGPIQLPGFSGRGVQVGNTWTPPAAYQRNPNPEAALPQWSAEEAQRSDAERERIRAALPARLRGAAPVRRHA